MAHSHGVDQRGTDAIPSPASLDATFDALTSRRRREILSVLASRDRPISEADLASSLASQMDEPTSETGESTSKTGEPPSKSDERTVDASDSERQRAHTRLRHVHLPKLAAAGLVHREQDRNVVSAASHPIFETPAFDDLVRQTSDEGTTADACGGDSTDAVFAALADERRRVALSVLKDAGRLELSDLAQRIAERDGKTSDEEVQRVRTGLHHVHVSKLVGAGLVAYDEEEPVVSYEGHPDFDERWLGTPFGARHVSSDADSTRGVE